MIKKLVLVAMGIVLMFGAFTVGYKAGRLVTSDEVITESNQTTALSIKQYSEAGKLIGYWNGEYSVETFGGGVILTNEAGNQEIVTGTVKIRNYKKGD